MKYYKKFLFRVEVDGIERAAFMDCSPLEAEVADVEVWEGGALVAHKEPGRVTFPDITLTRGLTKDRDMYDLWLKTLVASFGVEGAGLVGKGDEDGVEYSLDVVQLGRDQKEKARHRVHVAHTKKFGNGGWDNSADEAMIETLVMRVKYWEKIS